MNTQILHNYVCALSENQAGPVQLTGDEAAKLKSLLRSIDEQKRSEAMRLPWERRETGSKRFDPIALNIGLPPRA